MKTVKYISTIFNLMYVTIFLLFILDNLNSFDIKNQILKTSVYYGIIISTPCILIWNFIIFKTKWGKIRAITLPVLMLIFILINGPIKILFSVGTWKTQTILYKNGHLKFKKIEFQMQDLGLIGYNKRTVEVIYLTNLFMIVENVDPNVSQKVEWVKTDEEINELNLKD